MSKPLVACVGGFLGAGKTTAIAAAARELGRRGLRVGIVTNDQGSRLVDTTLLRAEGLPTEEVLGGCFCCRFDELVEHADRIIERERPDVLLAEAVGSCTDLAATVVRPLRLFYGGRFTVAPLSILVEPERLRDAMRLDGWLAGSVGYLFRAQLAEADAIVLNKTDLVDADEQRTLERTLEHTFPGIPVQPMSARTGLHVDAWVDWLLAASRAGRRAPNVDYERYAEAEAALGWLNATVDVQSPHPVAPEPFAASVVDAVRRRCVAAGAPIGHVKVLVMTAEGCGRASLVDVEGQPSWTAESPLAPAQAISAIVNARVASEPDTLERLVRDAIGEASTGMLAEARIQQLECFRPVAPRPTHRYGDAERWPVPTIAEGAS